LRKEPDIRGDGYLEFSGATSTQGYQSGNGYITISWP
jgi:hypothetical protein